MMLHLILLSVFPHILAKGLSAGKFFVQLWDANVMNTDLAGDAYQFSTFSMKLGDTSTSYFKVT